MLERGIDLKWFAIMMAQLGLFLIMILFVIRLFDIKKDKGKGLYVLWEKRDPMQGEDMPPQAFDLKTDGKRVKITDVFGKEKIRESKDGILHMNLTDTPVYVETIEYNL